MLVLIIIVAVVAFVFVGRATPATTPTAIVRPPPPPQNTADRTAGQVTAMAGALFGAALNSFQAGDRDSYSAEDDSGEDYSDIADGSPDNGL